MSGTSVDDVVQVMTTVYGVTYVGARDQIERQLRDRGDIPAEMCWSASAYLAKNVLASIGDLFKGANRRFKKVPWNKIVGKQLEKPLSEATWEKKVAKEIHIEALKVTKLFGQLLAHKRFLKEKKEITERS